LLNDINTGRFCRKSCPAIPRCAVGRKVDYLVTKR
jgi:hypothetical protein